MCPLWLNNVHDAAISHICWTMTFIFRLNILLNCSFIIEVDGLLNYFHVLAKLNLNFIICLISRVSYSTHIQSFKNLFSNISCLTSNFIFFFVKIFQWTTQPEHLSCLIVAGNFSKFALNLCFYVVFWSIV